MVLAHGDQVGLVAADEYCVFRHVLAHELSENLDAAVAGLVAVAAVDLAQAEQVKDNGGAGIGEGVGILGGTALEELVVLKAGEQVDVLGDIGEHIEVADNALALIAQAAVVAAQLPGGRSAAAELLADTIGQQGHVTHGTDIVEALTAGVVVKVQIRQQLGELFVVKDQLIGMVEEGDSLLNILKNGDGESLGHLGAAEGEGRPVGQQQPDAVAENGPVQLAEQGAAVLKKEDGVDQHNHGNGGDDGQVLGAVDARGVQALDSQNHHHQNDQTVGECQVPIVGPLHHVAVGGHGIGGGGVADSKFGEDVEKQHSAVQSGQTDDGGAHDTGEAVPVHPGVEVHKAHQRHQQPVDAGKVEAAGRGHAPVGAGVDAVEVGERDDTGKQGGQSQVECGLLRLAETVAGTEEVEGCEKSGEYSEYHQVSGFHVFLLSEAVSPRNAAEGEGRVTRRTD